MTNTNDLWHKYAQQILQVASPDFDPSKQQFSVASSTLAIDLGNADPAIANAYIYQMGNTIPAASPAYAPGSSLLGSYRLFLDSIDLGGDANPNLDPQINQAAAALTAAQNNFLTVQATAVSAWKTYQAINPNIGFNDYVTSQYPTYIQARNALSGAESAYAGLMTQKYGTGYEVIAQARDAVGANGGAADIAMQNGYNMAIKTGSVAPAGAVGTLPGQTPAPAASTLVQTFAPAFSLNGFASVYKGWQAASASGAAPAASIKVDGSAAASSWSDMGWTLDAAGGVSYGFFDMWAENSTSSDTQTAFAMQDEFSLQVDFVGLNVFTLTPGQWFDLGLLNTYKNKLLPNSAPFFTAQGALGRIPVQAVIGFNPTITLSMSHQDYSSFQSSFQSETTAGASFGPFVIGDVHSTAYNDKASVAFDSSSGTIKIAPPPSTVPTLLGMISTRLDV